MSRQTAARGDAPLCLHAGPGTRAAAPAPGMPVNDAGGSSFDAQTNLRAAAARRRNRTAIRRPLAVLLCLFFAGSPGLAAPPVDPLAPLRYAIDTDSPTIGGMLTADDILGVVAAAPAILVGGADIDLDRTSDDLDAISRNIVELPSPDFALLFSVDRDTIGAGLPLPALVMLDVPYNVADQAARGQACGDVFMSTSRYTITGPALAQDAAALNVPGNTLVLNQYDEGGTDLALTPEVDAETHNTDQQRDDANAAESDDAGVAPGPSSPPVYFSLTKASTSLLFLPGMAMPSGAHIFFNADPFDQDVFTTRYAGYGQLFLEQDDDIDALIVFDNNSDGMYSAGDQVLFSLTPGSPSLATFDRSAADVFTVTFGAMPTVFASAAALGLREEDNLNALELLLCDDTLACAKNHGIRRLTGDADNDGDHDLADHNDFAACLSGPDQSFDTDGAATHVVTITPGTHFSPATAIVEAGDSVRWEWDGGVHNVVSGRDATFDGNFSSGAPIGDPDHDFTVAFTPGFLNANPMPAGVYPYFCGVHQPDPDATGRVIVLHHPCARFDFDKDGDVDTDDYGDFSRLFAP